MSDADSPPAQPQPPLKKKRGPKPGAKRRKQLEAQAQAERDLQQSQQSQSLSQSQSQPQTQGPSQTQDREQREGSEDSLGGVSGEDLEPAPAPTASGSRGRAQGQAGAEDSDDAEDDEDADAAMVDDMLEDQDSAKREEVKKAFAILMRDHFSEDQKDRYEVYRRSGFKSAAVRRLVNHVLQQSVSANIVLAFRGLSKVFVGEIVESARQVQAAHGQSGPLLPEHIREAWRMWDKQNQVPGGPKKKLFSQ